MTGRFVKAALPAALVTYLAFGNAGFAQEQGSQSQRSQSQRSQSYRAQQQAQAQQSRTQTVRGEVIGMKRVDVRGTDLRQLVVHLKTPQGRRVVADLGSAQDKNLKNLGITLGDQITVKGRAVRVGDRTVLAATQVRANGKTAQLDRDRQWRQIEQIAQRERSRRTTRSRQDDEQQVSRRSQAQTSGAQRGRTREGREVSDLERDLAGGEFLTQADRDLRERIWTRLVNRTELADALNNVRIVVDNGEVTLRGSVDSRQDKNRIGETVEQIRGVKTVNNQLRVATGSTASRAWD